jgi:hypothetical protein
VLPSLPGSMLVSASHVAPFLCRHKPTYPSRSSPTILPQLDKLSFLRTPIPLYPNSQYESTSFHSVMIYVHV